MEWKFSEFSKFRESDEALNMHWGQFKDHVSHICPPGAVVASRFLTKELVGSKTFDDK